MKKLFTLLFAVIIVAFSAQAQTKPDTTKVKPAPIYQPDLTSKHDVILNGISIQQLNDWVIYAQNGPEAISNSDRISAKQATEITKNYFTISTYLKGQLDSLLAKDKLKWQADTAKKGKSK
jgi:hypothetical protein